MSMMMWGMGGRRVDQIQQDGMQEGKILVSRCAKCSIVHNPPRAMCPNCHSLEWEWFECSGLGHVHAWVVPRHGVPEGETSILILMRASLFVMRSGSSMSKVLPSGSFSTSAK